MSQRRTMKCVVVALTFAFVLSAFVVMIAPVARAALWVQTTDADFNAARVINGAEVIGTGSGAYVELLKDNFNWFNKNPSTAPSARQGMGACYDSRNGRTMIFGGYTAAGPYVNDTWGYYKGNNTWQQIQATAPPRTRSDSQMAFDSIHNIAILFGGYTPGGVQLTDTWEYNAVTGVWTNTTTGVKPSLTSWPLTFDSTQGKVLTAGWDTKGTGWQTWAYDQTTHAWAQRTGATPPQRRAGHGMAYFADIDRTVLYGGSEMMNTWDETWEYNYNTDKWTNYTGNTGGFSPGGRSSFGWAYRSTTFDLMLYGGSPGYPTSTWRYFSSGGNRYWSQVSTSSNPPGRIYLAMAFDAGANASIIFGGRNSAGVRLGDTWAFEPGYRTGGFIVSYLFDSLHANTQWKKIFWNQTPANVPAGTSLQFQLATCQNPEDSACLNYLGPDGTGGTWYTTPGTAINAGASPARYINYYGLLSNPLATDSPHLEDVSIEHTAASIPPNVISKGPISPPGVPVTTNAWINFTEPMNTAQVTVRWITLSPPGPDVTKTDNWDPTSSKLTMTHSLPLSYCTQYRISITQAQDQEGQSMASLPYNWTIVTICPPPEILAAYPHQSDTDIPLTSAIYVNFSKPMNQGLTFVNTTPALNSPTYQWSGGSQNLKVINTGNLQDCTIYTVNVSGRDQNDMDLVPGMVPNPFTFETHCLNPRVMSTDPPNAWFEVALNRNVIITFSNPMNTGAVNVAFTPALVLTKTWNSPTDTILTLTHPPNFAPCTTYTANVTGQDKTGQPLQNGYYSFWFFTSCGGSPYVVSTMPMNNAVDVPVNLNPQFVFSETMVPSSVTLTSVPNDWTWNPEWAGSNMVLTLNHTTLFSPCQRYYLNVTGGRDANEGKTLVPGPVPDHIVFDTICTNPYVKSIVPADGSVNVLNSTNVVITFSKAINTTAFMYQITPSISLIESWTNGNTVFHLDHGPLFADGTLYTIRILSAPDLDGNPLVLDNAFNFTTLAVTPNPYIVYHDPVDKQTGVPLTKEIYIVFSKSMDTATLLVQIVPSVATVPSWSGLNKYLNLSHGPFASGTKYNVTIQACDTLGNCLTSGPVPNPWEFTTLSSNPIITSTDPADLQTNVPTNKAIVVNFNKAMNTGTVIALIMPGIAVTPTWSNGDTRVTYSHTPPLADCTEYTVTMSGQDTFGNSLVSGPVPNPWKFTTTCVPGTPGGLTVVRSGNDIVLNWRAATLATGYHVYTSANRFAAWPWATMYNVTGTTYTATGHNGDTSNHFYVVRAYNAAWYEGANSTMGVKMYRQFAPNPGGSSAQYLSLPYNTIYQRASDITAELTDAKINVVGKWDPVKQQTIIRYWFHGLWRGPDFTISRGDGIFIGVVSTFSWSITGTDTSYNIAFTFRPSAKTNLYFISLPYANSYVDAQSIASELTNGKIKEIGRFNPSTYRWDVLRWTGATWAGVNFQILPGDGYYLSVVSSFNWAPKLITPEVP